MVRFITVSFGLLGLGFYELSGGSDFEPTDWRNTTAPEIEVSDLSETAPASSAEVSIATSADAGDAKNQTAEQTRVASFTVDRPSAQGTDDQTDTSASSVTASNAKEDPLVVLASIPTTRGLVGSAAPTPKTERTKLGPADAPLVATDEAFAEAIALEKAPDMRRVTGNRVNMRNGPGTQYSVVGKLLRGNQVEVLQDPGQGWVKLKVLDSGRIGWMSANLLRKIEF